MDWYVVLFYSAWTLKALYTPAPFTQVLFHAFRRTFTCWCMYRLARLFLLWMAFHLKTAIALGPTNQHIHPIDISLEAWYLNSSGDQFRSSLLILSQHALISRQRIPSPASLIPYSLFGKCLSHIPRACLIQSGVEFCMRWETGPRGHAELCLLNHIVLVFPTPSSVDIRWPCHFIFLSCCMMNEVSGTRCFLESSSRTAEANASIRHLQKWLCQSSVFSCYGF